MPNMGKYKCVRLPSHHRATKEGMVYEHIVEAEKKIGRILKADEVVHHCDFNKFNNIHSNLIVFCSKSAHMRFHSNGCDTSKLVHLEDGSYDCRVSERKICPVCGTPKDYKAKLCLRCRREHNAKHIPKSNELINELMAHNMNLSATARTHNVTFSTIKKWCRKYGIDYKQMKTEGVNTIERLRE